MLFYFIGDTHLAYSNVISIAYVIDKEQGKVDFTITYSNNKYLYKKQIAKDVLLERFNNGQTYSFKFDDRPMNVQLVNQLSKIYEDEWFHINSKFVKHPVWARKLIKYIMFWGF